MSASAFYLGRQVPEAAPPQLLEWVVPDGVAAAARRAEAEFRALADDCAVHLFTSETITRERLKALEVVAAARVRHWSAVRRGWGKGGGGLRCAR